MNNSKKYWYIVPSMVLDRTKYQGKGRPKKTDYRMFPGPQDLKPLIWEVELPKGIIISHGSAN